MCSAAGKDAYATAPTWTGKTLAYLLPVFCRIDEADRMWAPENLKALRALVSAAPASRTSSTSTRPARAWPTCTALA